MTLQASGSMTGADIRNELRQSGGDLTFPDATTRWLSEKPSGSLTLPTDFYSQTAVKNVHTSFPGIGANSAVVGVNLGTDFPNRRLIVCVAVIATGVASQILVNSATLGAASLTSGPGQAWFNASRNITSGIFYAPVGSPTGTSATLTVNCNQSIASIRIVIYSVSNIPTIYAARQGGAASGTGASVSPDLPVDTNGVVIASFLKGNSGGGGISMSGVIEDTDSNLGTCQYATGFQNRLSFQAGRPISFSGSGAADIVIVAAASFT